MNVARTVNSGKAPNIRVSRLVRAMRARQR
jgi:hypothetical protein